ncbi:hypothetical protein SAMN04487783_1740 [Agrococcus baldri]|uniref:Uncharacterized protein n=1 Tax=Agrococcus baldri TaxID=153730 RepID=A0AA94KZW9_9MICO|nr:DUF6069 family protein [Agrococcus baldri]SFS13973.1 hypothetical protein SAMN04487783_1740 [Agrococcus baldri]
MTIDIDTTAETAPGVFASREARRRRRLRRLGTIVLAALLATAIWAVAVPIAGVTLVVGSGQSAQHVGPASVAIVSFALGLVAWALLALLERLGPAGRRTWQVAGLLVLIVSLAGPLAMGGALPVLLTLEAMHLVVGVTVILGLAHRPADA